MDRSIFLAITKALEFYSHFAFRLGVRGPLAALPLLVFGSLCLAPATASASVSVSPASTVSNYKVSWTESSGGQTKAYLYEKYGSGSWSSTRVTGKRSKSYSKTTSGTYYYKLQTCFYEPELRREICNPYSNTVSVNVQYVSTPGSLDSDPTGTDGSYKLSWEASSGTVTRYELWEDPPTSGWVRIHNQLSPLSKTLSGKPDGAYFYRVRACNSAGCSG